MCTVCGCSGSHEHDHEHHHGHAHSHDAGHVHFGEGEAGVSVPGMSQARLIQIETDILGKNNSYADNNRALLAAKGVLALNLVSSPGSGKTTLLVETLKRMAGPRLRSSKVISRRQTMPSGSGKREYLPFRSTPARGAIWMRTWSVMPWRSCR